jgi:CelD/BcsL family acetyltransferase involved in cellulose biosynthesis
MVSPRSRARQQVGPNLPEPPAAGVRATREPFIENSLPRSGGADAGIGHSMTTILHERPAGQPHVAAPGVAARPDAIALEIHENLAALEPEWRAFERVADCTVFQTYDWLAAWQRHIGPREGAAPAIVAGRTGGDLLFVFPLAVHGGLVRRLTWLGQDQCDYNAPLLSRSFAEHATREKFLALWHDVRALIATHPALRHDLVELRKMPETVGSQPNPFLHLDVALTPSGAHLAHLSGTWEEFYAARRSSATRRRDRSKRKKLGEFGEVRFVNPSSAAEISATLETLIAQKTRSFSRMGVANLFARPGRREFFTDLASGEATRDLVHVSRLDVGSICAAANLGLQFRGCYYHVLASYDDGEVSRFGPGSAHLRDLIERAMAGGCHTFDFTIGDERYKLEWSDTLLRLYDHSAAASARGVPLVLAAQAFRSVKRAIKQNPVLWSAFTRARAALGALAGQRKEAAEADDALHAKSPPIAPEH